MDKVHKPITTHYGGFVAGPCEFPLMMCFRFHVPGKFIHLLSVAVLCRENI
jgi:hypothetical protein